MLIVIALFGYLLGSVPFGLLLTRAAGLGDIRAIGSGNIGATNVLRTGNKKLAAAVLLLDALKGGLAVALAGAVMGAEAAMTAGLFAVIGHVFPVWLKFKGGKGVATALGVLLAFNPLLGAMTCGIWLAMAFSFRYSSLSALVALGLSPVMAMIATMNIWLALVCALIAGLVFYTHRANMTRLMKGTEPKIGEKKKETDESAPAAQPE